MFLSVFPVILMMGESLTTKADYITLPLRVCSYRGCLVGECRSDEFAAGECRE